jgi:hypothetical protein
MGLAGQPYVPPPLAAHELGLAQLNSILSWVGSNSK